MRLTEQLAYFNADPKEEKIKREYTKGDQYNRVFLGYSVGGQFMTHFTPSEQDRKKRRELALWKNKTQKD